MAGKKSGVVKSTYRGNNKTKRISGSSEPIGGTAPFCVSEDLLKNPELFRQVIDCLPNGLVLFDTKDRLIAYNENYRLLSGLNKNDLKGSPTFKELLHKVVIKNKLINTGKDKRLWIKERLASFKNSDAPFEVTFNDGRTLKVQDRHTESGYTVRIYEDITQLTNRERRLVESTLFAQTAQKRLEDAIESISEGFVLFDRDGRLVMCNSRYRKLNSNISGYIKPGILRSDLIKKVASIRFRGRPKKERNDWINLRLKHHRSPGSVLECVFQDGTWIRYQDFETNDGGRVSLYADITDKKRNELALQKSERRFQQAVESMPDGFVIYDQKDRLLLFNERYKELSASAAPFLVPGQTYENIIRAFAKRSLSSLSDTKRRAWVRKRVDQHKNPGKPTEFQFDNGQWIRYVDFKTPDGMLVSLLTDTTELRDREQALLESEARLESAHNKLVDAIESMSETFIMFDADDKLVMHNSKYAETFKTVPETLHPGISMSEVVRIMARKNIYNDVSGNLDTYVTNRMKILKKPGIREQQLSDGSWWLVKSSRTAEGGTVFVRENITGQKIHEQALRDSEARQEAAHKKLVDAVENMSEDFSMFDADGKLISYNSKFLNYYKDVPGILSPDIRLKDIVKYFAQKGLYGVFDGSIDGFVKHRLKELNTPGTYETRFSDNSWWLVRTNRTSDGGLVMIRHEITEQKNAAIALLESEERYSLVIKAANEGVWDWNLDTNQIYASRRFEQIVGKEVAKKLESNNKIVLEEFIYSNMHPQDMPVYQKNLIRHVWTAQRLQGKSFLIPLSVGCGHVSGLLMRYNRPLALM
ncbi:MAG: PAS-domain containing protein, partial [Rhodospirillales bacterium]|nr:PAS-domain containing protein [Rhodospirillales bacterium]